MKNAKNFNAFLQHYEGNHRPLTKVGNPQTGQNVIPSCSTMGKNLQPMARAEEAVYIVLGAARV